MPKMCCCCSQNYYCDFVKESSAGMASVNVNKKEVKRTDGRDSCRRQTTSDRLLMISSASPYFGGLLFLLPLLLVRL